MKCYINSIMILSMVIAGCSHKIHKLSEQETTKTHWGEDIVRASSYDVLIDCCYVSPFFFDYIDRNMPDSFGGARTSPAPQAPRATPFHYVLHPQSDAPRRGCPVPVYVRKRTIMHHADSTGATNDHFAEVSKKEETVKESAPWYLSKIVIVLAFVGIIGLFVYFVWRVRRYFVPL